MSRTVRTCLEPDCRRARVPHYSRCKAHLDALLYRVFGRPVWLDLETAA